MFSCYFQGKTLLPFLYWNPGQSMQKPDEHFCLFFEDLRVLICYSRVPRLLKRPLTAPSFGQTRGNICPKGITRIDRERYIQYVRMHALQRQNTEISKQIFPEKEYRGLSPSFHIHASVSDLYIPTIGLPILLEEICRPILGLYIL